MGSYSETDIESVSLSNGNLHLSIPLASLPTIAGGKLGFTLNASYNSKLWDMTRREEMPGTFSPSFVKDVPQQNTSGRWIIGAGYSINFRDSKEDFRWLPPPNDPVNPDPEYDLLTQNQFVKVELTMPDGATHELRPVDYAPYQMTRDFLWGYYKDRPDTISPPGPMRYYSFDGSFIWAKLYPSGNAIRWELYLPDGTKIAQRNNGIQRIWDSGGSNAIKIFSDADPNNPLWITTHFIDEQTGREIKHEFDATGEHVQYQTVGGIWMSIDIIGGQTTVSGKTYRVSDLNANNQPCERQELLQSGVSVIRAIVLPVTEPGQPGRRFTFSYNTDPPLQATNQDWQQGCSEAPIHISNASTGWGSLSQMVTPAGAIINYSYNMDGVHRIGPQGGFENNDLPRESLTQKRVTHDGITETWNYFSTPLGGSVEGPDGSLTTESCYTHDPAYSSYYGGPDGMGGLVYRSTRSNAEIVERHWTLKKFAGANDIMPGSGVHPPFNAVVDAEYTTVIDPANSNNNKMSAKLYSYDYNGNMTSETAYDWFNANSVNRDSFGVPTGVPLGTAVLRVLNTSYYNPAPVVSDPGSANVYAKRALATATPLILNAPQQTIVGPGKTRLSYDNQAYGVAPTAGNVTTEERWDDRGSKWLPTIHLYDSLYGNRTSTRDPRGNLISFVYDSLTHAQPVQIIMDPLNGTGSQTTQTTYDFSTGVVTSQTDSNQKTTNIDYMNQRLNTVDPYGRPGLVVGPAVTSTVDGVAFANQQRRVITKYYDNGTVNNAFQVEVISDLNQQNDSLLKTRTTQDQMGRAVLTETSENGSSYTISARTVYEQVGRITYSTNPYRSGPAPTDGWTRSTRDNAGRVVEVATFSGAAQPPSSGTNGNWTGSVTTSYNAAVTTVTDQAIKSRRSIVDGLGRLKQIIEDPNGVGFVTTYGYDVLGDLTQIAQGVQTRTFTYDSLSRLREAYSPEQVNPSGVRIATSYQYDDASNLTRRDNPNGSFVTFGPYDGLNRVTQKTLSTGGTWVYSYDTGLNGKGKLVSVVRQGSTDGCYYYGFDAAGQLNASRQITTTPQGGTQTYSMSYGYNLAGGMTKEVYPSGKEVRTSYDSAGRLSQVSRYIGPAFDKTYASGFSYTAHGAVSSMSLAGGAMSEQTTYNSRLQPTKMDARKVSTNELLVGLDYGFGTTANNGNMQTQTVRIGGTATPTTTFNQSFTYDPLNRLLTATEEAGNNWSQTNGYDQYGNRWVSSGYIPPQNVGLTPQPGAFSAATNRLLASGYDISGNQIQDGPGRQFTYDSENRQLTFNTTTGIYTYDGDGRRVTKTDPMTGTTVFVYNAGGQLLAEYTSGAGQPNGTSYLTTDHLGSTRLVTDGSGVVKARHDYLPFGEEIPATIGRGSVAGYGSTDSTRQRFTQKERDNESGLDYFLARYYSSAQGRFTSPDEFTGGPDELYYFAATASENPTFYADLFAPQSLNKYQYAYNNPLRYVDPDGHQERDRSGNRSMPAPPFTLSHDQAKA